MKSISRRASAAAVVAPFLLIPYHAGASGFAIPAQSGSAAGSAFAGAAEAEDSSVLWFNPAGAVRLKGRNFAVAANFIEPSFKFHDDGSTGVFGAPGSGDGGDAGHGALVPETYATAAIGDAWHVGIALNAPFGLKTDFQTGWRGRLVAERSEVKTYNVNPAVAYRIGGSLSIGAGIDWQHLTANLTNFAGPLGNAALHASDSAWGYNFGALFEASERARLGIAFRSAIHYSLRGTAAFAAGEMFGSAVKADLTVPESLTVHGLIRVTSNWELMANSIWTRWSRVQTLDVMRTSASVLGATGSTLTTLPFEWRDTYYFAMGASYRVNDRWKMQMGVAHDLAASNDSTRTPRLPDQSRISASTGARWYVSANGTIDAAYTHDFIKNAGIADTAAPFPGSLNGSFRNSANALSVQFTDHY